MTDKPVVVITGHFGYEPNRQGADWMARKIWPSVRREFPEAELVLAGFESDRVARELNVPGLHGTGEVPDMSAVLSRARVAAVPILLGGGSRLKILEALACGIPVVTTSMGCEGIGAVDGMHLWIRDSPDSFLEAVLQLLKKDMNRELVRHRGRALVEARYSYDAMRESIMDLAEA